MTFSLIPIYLGSFLRRSYREGEIEKYLKDRQLEIPLEDFYNFIFRKLVGRYGVLIYGSKEKVREELKINKNLDMIGLEEDKIVLDKKKLELMIRMCRGTILNHLNIKIPYLMYMYIKFLYSSLTDKEREELGQTIHDYESLGKDFIRDLERIENML